jgi:hypothetical protein
MAAIALSSFSPTAAIPLAVNQAGVNVALPTAGTPTIAVVTNLSQQIVYVALGASTVTVVPGAGMAIMPADSVALTIGTNTNLAAVTLAGLAGLNIAVGN